MAVPLLIYHIYYYGANFKMADEIPYGYDAKTQRQINFILTHPAHGYGSLRTGCAVGIIPHTISIDWSLLPVSQMLVYQYFSRWKIFLVAEVILSSLLSFVGKRLADDELADDSHTTLAIGLAGSERK